MTSCLSSRKQGFTLVELLVVITIIGILAGLTLYAVGRVMPSIQDSVVRIEIRNIGQALENYKQEKGAYPPDMNTVINPINATATDPENLARVNLINRHLSKLFPQRVASEDVPTAALTATYANGAANRTRLIAAGNEFNIVNTAAPAGSLELYELEPHEVFVLFLMGFSPDVERPLTGSGERQRLFEFDQARLIDEDNDGWWSYKPDYNESEIVYFESKSYATFNPSTFDFSAGSGSIAEVDFNDPATPSLATGQVRPYARFSANGVAEFVNPKSFQLITAGRDGNFGSYTAGAIELKFYPSGLGGVGSPGSKNVGYKSADRDNIASFTAGSNLAADEDLEIDE